MTKHHHGHPHTQDHAQDTEEVAQEAMNMDGQDGSEATEKAATEDAGAEVARLKDQLLRSMAETENTRRRLAKEAEDAGKYALASFAKEILVVSDNFTRALEAVPKDAAEHPAVKTLVTGVEATERQLQAVLERFGIQKIEAMDKPFDPNLHQVMMEIEDPSKPAGTVVQVLQGGYRIHGRLLREALVAVAKGGPARHSVDQSA